MTQFRNDLTAEYVRSILDYDPVTGVFTWKKRSDVGFRWNTNFAGKEAGSTNTQKCGKKYKVLRINSRDYLAHRVAWLLVTGEWPHDRIDHEDSDGTNNRWSNLREATTLENNRNQRRRRDNSSGFKGVDYHKGARMWRSRIRSDGREHHLGLFNSPEAAHAAYCAAAEKYHGEFARTT